MFPVDWHPQDWILIVEAIETWDENVNGEYIRHHRARELQIQIAAMHGFDDPERFLSQADSNKESLKRAFSVD